MIKRTVVGGIDLRSSIDFQTTDKDAVTPTGVARRNNRRPVGYSQFAKIAAEAAFAIAFIGIVITSFYCGRTFDSNIYRVGGDAVMVTLRCRQGRVVRDNNLPRDFCVTIIYVFVRINIDAAATALSLFTRFYRSSVHKPADGEVRIILNAQVTAVVDAQAAAARVVRLEVRNIHDGALVQNQCAGAKEYCRDIGIFFIGVAGVRSRIDSQLAAVLDGHFAAGRIDTLLFQR